MPTTGRESDHDQFKNTLGNPPQSPPGDQGDMDHDPVTVPDGYKPAGKLTDKVALITGGDSGIGRSVAALFALEGADVAVLYDKSDSDASDTKALVEKAGRKCLLLKGDVGDEAFCKHAVAQTVETLGRLNVLVNNAAEQHPQESIADVTEEQLTRTFRTNFFGYFFMAKHSVPHLKEGDSIINTCSVTAFEGHKDLLDYSSTKGAIVAFTRSLSANLKPRKIRVNSVAPGPVWTPLIPSTFPPDQLKKFGSSTLWERAAEPGEIATAYVFLASTDGVFYSGQTLHPNGGTVVAG